MALCCCCCSLFCVFCLDGFTVEEDDVEVVAEVVVGCARMVGSLLKSSANVANAG